jgi:hypothetical protein
MEVKWIKFAVVFLAQLFAVLLGESLETAHSKRVELFNL